MSNTRVDNVFTDINPTQSAPKFANRTNFVPGTSGAGRLGAMNWELDFRIPLGVPALDGHYHTSYDLSLIHISEPTRPY